MASNRGVVLDNLGDSSDWIELYNASNRNINLKNYFLTDKVNNISKFSFPELILPPSSFHVVWASGDEHNLVPLPAGLDIYFKSAGIMDGNFSIIMINGIERSLNKRGINIALLSSEGRYLNSLHFDTYRSAAASDSLVHCLKSLRPGQLIVFSVKDEASHALSDEARATVAALGSKKIDDLDMRDSWGMIAIKDVGVVCECFRKKGTGLASSKISNIHTNFKLDKEGEYIGLYDANSNLVDSVTFDKQIPDKSFGRIPITSTTWSFLSNPTPGTSNNVCKKMNGKTEPPRFTPLKNIHSEPINIEIEAQDSDCKIYYTLDSCLPDDQDHLYDKPLLLKQTTVIRAYCTKENYFDSDVVTKLYIIHPTFSLPVISLVTSSDNLWNPDYGIYTVGSDSLRPNYKKRGKEWQRPGHFSFLNSKNQSMISSECGLRIHGGTSRNIPKKSFRIYFPNLLQFDEGFEFGKFIKQDVFVLSGGGNDSVADSRPLGRNWSLIRDQLMIQLYGSMGYPEVHKISVILYLNGRYWGIYQFGERINEHFLKNHTDFEKGDLIKDNTIVEEGSFDQWQKTIDFFKNADLNVEKNYEKVSTLINIKNFTDYYILNLFGANWDWPNHNIYCYCDLQNDVRWNWLLWDADCAFLNSPPYNTLHEVITTQESNEIFFNLIRCDKYRTYFIDRTCYLLNHRITPKYICSIVDSLSATIEGEIDEETQRWGGSKRAWLENIEKIKIFARERPDHFRNIINAELDAGKNVYLNIFNDIMPHGIVKINDNQIEQFPFYGVYFADFPIRLRVEPRENYIFKTWGNGLEADEFTVKIKEQDSLNLFLEFEEISSFKRKEGVFKVLNNYPNPFNSRTNIKFFAVTETEINIAIFNIMGRIVSAMNKQIDPGYSIYTWDGKNETGHLLPSGVYFCVMSGAGKRVVNKLTLLR
jgi:hypothetical protein